MMEKEMYINLNEKDVDILFMGGEVGKDMLDDELALYIKIKFDYEVVSVLSDTIYELRKLKKENEKLFKKLGKLQFELYEERGEI